MKPRLKAMACNVLRLPPGHELMKVVAFVYNDMYHFHPYEEMIEAPVLYEEYLMAHVMVPSPI